MCGCGGRLCNPLDLIGSHALHFVVSSLTDQLGQFDSGGPGRIMFEIGATLAAVEKWASLTHEQNAAWERAVNLYKHWCNESKQATLYWIWLARLLVPKDIRTLIAHLIWEAKATWSERKTI